MAVGVICEYNPFHKGHLHHLEATRKSFADEPVIALMSGHLVQRGDIALMDKSARAKMALLGGADVVLELPLAAACAAAGDFARGGMEALRQIGVDKLSFGSEAGDIAPLREAVALLGDETFDEKVKALCKQGLSFAAARQRAADLLRPDIAPMLSTPNNLLALEYMRAGRDDFTYFTIKREGAPHDGVRQDAAIPLSASAVREGVKTGDQTALSALPDFAREIYLEEVASGRAPAFLAGRDRVVLAHMRRLRPDDLARFPDCSDGLDRRILKCVNEAKTLQELYDLAKTKRYTHARIRRVITRAFFGVTADVPLTPPYLRLLAVNDMGRAFLRDCKGGLPVITRPSDIRRLSPEAARLGELEAGVTDLWSLFTPEIQPAGAEWRRTPVYLK